MWPFSRKKKQKKSFPVDGEKNLFPLYGVTLGITTVDELLELAGQQYIHYEFTGVCAIEIGGINFFCEEGRAERISLSSRQDFPNKWKGLGLDWSLSYNEWIRLLEYHGFSIERSTVPRALLSGTPRLYTHQVVGRRKENKRRFFLETKLLFYIPEYRTANTTHSLQQISFSSRVI